MDNPLQVFTNEEFGEVRVIGDFENPLFCLADLCRILGLRVDKVVERLKKDDPSKDPLSKGDPGSNGDPFSEGVLSKHPVQTAGGVQLMYFVNEDGFYDVLFDSRKPIAKRLRKWVTAEVLPAIRKYGYYSLMPSAAPVVTKREKNPNRVNGQHTESSPYLAHKKDNFNIIKIGQSHDPENRVSQIKDMDRDDIYQMPLMPRAIARALEASFHNRYAPFKLEGEFFCANFYEVRDFMRSFEKPFAKLKLVSETAVRKAITDLKAFMNDPSIKKIAAPPTK